MQHTDGFMVKMLTRTTAGTATPVATGRRDKDSESLSRSLADKSMSGRPPAVPASSGSAKNNNDNTNSLPSVSVSSPLRTSTPNPTPIGSSSQITVSSPSTSTSTPPLPIRFRTNSRNTVYDVMRDRGWRETEGDSMDWDFFWADVHWVHDQFDHVYLGEGQRINHFRNHYELTRKDLLVKNVKRMIKTIEKEYGKPESLKFDFLSPSYVLPGEHALFTEEFKRNPGSVWIMKPVGKAQGKGIFLINRMSQISGWRKDVRGNVRGEGEEGPEAYIVQRYIENPCLIGGKKFDIRIYVLVTSYYPLTVYLHRSGFCRFSATPFSMQAKDISNLFIHATNVAIQKHSPNYSSNRGCKWLLRNLKVYLVTRYGGKRVDELFTEMEASVVRSLMSVQKVMINDKHCFELYGYDILIDDNLKPWLLEVNASPSLTAETQFDYDLKHAMLSDCFDVVDLEKRHANKPIRPRVGGFDLVYNDGPVRHERTSQYASYLGCYCPIPKAPRVKKRFGRGEGPSSGGSGSGEKVGGRKTPGSGGQV